MLRGCSIVKVSRAKVITIEPSADALSVEEADKLFSMAFARVCALRVVDEVVVDGLTVGWRRLERWRLVGKNPKKNDCYILRL
jgi:hypothetical protein